jgi:hypothetical protein
VPAVELVRAGGKLSGSEQTPTVPQILPLNRPAGPLAAWEADRLHEINRMGSLHDAAGRHIAVRQPAWG